MLTFYLLFGILYAGSLLWLGAVWKQSHQTTEGKRADLLVSILVPYRNESKNILGILDAVQSLRHRPLQLIFINDQSEDEGPEILKESVKKKFADSFEVILLQSKGEGKKAALETGVEYAKSDILLTTDADCKLPFLWVEYFLDLFEETSTQLVAGPVISKEGTGFIHSFQLVEWASILLVTQAGFTQGNPLMCSGANLAFRKSTFLTVKGYEGNRSHLSGDDEFLLKKISTHYGSASVKYLNHINALVYTKPENSWGSLFSQKIRWASKWKMHKQATHQLAAVLPVAIQLVFISSPILLCFGIVGFLSFLLLWSMKLGAEYMVLGTVLKTFEVNKKITVFLKVGLIHPFYIVRVAVGAILGKFEWKGRNSFD